VVRVSVEIATKDRVGEIYGCLVSLYAQSFTDWDLVIVDDSTDPLRNVKYVKDLLFRMKYEGHGVRYIHNAGPKKGVCWARNKAAQSAFGVPKYHVRVDDDSIMAVNFLQKLVETAERLESEGHKVGGVGGIVPPIGEPITELDVPVVFNEVVFTDGSIQVADDGGYGYFDSEPVKSHHLRSSFLFTHEAFLATGGHSEHYGSVYAFREETDFCFKLKNAGFELFTVPSAICWHGASPFGGSRSPQQAQAVRVNDEYFQRKWLHLKRRGRIKAGVFTGV